MKIAVYGVSRSGKDYFINDLIKAFDTSKEIKSKLYHVNGSTFLKEIAIEMYKKDFKSLSELEKGNVRKEFVNKVTEIEKEKGSIIVDGHYAFYKDNMEFNKVFTEYDLNFYDYFFYLDSNPDDIVNRMRLSEGEKKNDTFTKEDIIKWKNYEVDNMTEDLLTIDKELHVIKYENDLGIKYVLGVISGEYDSKIKAAKMLEHINLDDYSSIILTDCDKTLSYEDTTDTWLKLTNKEGSRLKEIYKYDRYTNYQALEAKYYLSDGDIVNGYKCDPTLIKNNITLNKELIADLKTKFNTKVLAITAGNSTLWQELLKGEGLNAEVLDADLIMSKFVKYFVLKGLQEKGKYVIAIGDSMLDSLMLRFANKSYIISNKGKRENIQKLLVENPRIHQLGYSSVLYDDVYTDNSIDSIRTLAPLSNEAIENIRICKSDSGIEGLKLRKAHYDLGNEVAKLIKADYPSSEFVVIIMMRSGLCFGQGIVDYFDCSEVFYDDSSIEKFEKEFYGNPNYKDKQIILVDGVINSGKSMKEIISKMNGYKTIIATNVISSKFSVDYIHPIYATRISGRSFVGAKQHTISNGKGPDTSDRLFKNM